jgi:hypothetical protein
MFAVGGFAVGGFAIGIVYNVVTDLLRPASTHEVARVSAASHVPIYATAPAPATASDPVEPASRTRSRPSIAKVTPPSIGTHAVMPSPGTDRRGGGTDGRGGDAAVSPKAVAQEKAAEDRLRKVMQICRGC